MAPFLLCFDLQQKLQLHNLSQIYSISSKYFFILYKSGRPLLLLNDFSVLNRRHLENVTQ